MSRGDTVLVDEELVKWAWADRGVEQDAGAFVVGTGPSAAAQLETSSGGRTSRLVQQGGACKMAPATPGWLLKLMSNCLDCFGGLPVAPADEESGRSEEVVGWYSMSPHPDCSVQGHSMMNERADLERGG